MEENYSALLSWIGEITKNDCALAFSGGIDSAFLLKLLCDAARDHGTRIHAITFDTVLHPRQDAAIARELAEAFGAVHQVIFVDELQSAGILNNPKKRCYLCKKCLFEQLLHYAGEQNIHTILEGTNADDLNTYRPGIQAVRELGIKSPLAEFGFSKAQIRRLSAELSISVANRPSTPCMATRIPYGHTLSLPLLKKIEEAEEFLKRFDLYNVRVRVHEPIVRLETDPDSFPVVLENRETIQNFFHGLGFPYITLDLDGFRSGSMDLEL